MADYRRACVAGGSFFLTIVTNYRRAILTAELGRRLLRRALIETGRERPFTIDAMVMLPDHFHTVWTLPDGDADFSTRVRLVKGRFTHHYREAGGLEGGQSKSRRSKGERSTWQRRFWEHVVRDDEEYERICDYIHYNPVKHGQANCPHAWPYSSFHRFVRGGRYEPSWNCVCRGRAIEARRDFESVCRFAGE
jgi:putative transposase